MMYTVNDLYDGMELVCEDTVGVAWWTTGETYTVNKSFVAETIERYGAYFITDNSGDKRAMVETILDGLNNPDAPIKFTEVKEEKEEEETMAKRLEIKVGQVFQCISSNVEWWTSGKNYNVVLFNGSVGIMDEDNDFHRADTVGSDTIQIGTTQFRLHKVEEVAYIECVNSHDVHFWTSGKKYPITKLYDEFVVYDDEGDVRDDISPSALFEQLENNSRALFTLHIPNMKVPEIDILDRMAAKVEQLTNDASLLFDKRDRINDQAFALNAKAREIEEAMEVIERFK